MTGLLVAALVICSARASVALVAGAKDSSNRFPETGALIVWAGPNTAGIPEGLRAICSGALIHERVFLTAGHCVGRGVRGVPPFVQVAVSFDPGNAFDRASWVPVTRLLIHPSLPEACLSAPGCDPTSTGVFPAGDPARADVGLAILGRPVRNIKPAVLARPGALTDARVARLPMTVVGYGSTEPIPPDPAPPASRWDGSRRFRTSAFEKAVNDYWGTWRLPSRVCHGDSGAPTFVNDVRDKGARRLVAVVSDGGMDCASADGRVRVDTTAMQEWIASSTAQHAAQPERLLSRRYTDGDRIQYLMKGQEDGSTYEVRITATTSKAGDGRFVEEFAWSDMVANGAPRSLPATSQPFRLAVTLDGGAPFEMPDLSKARGLIGPVTDVMTFYADLFLAMHQGALSKAGDHFYFANPMTSSWADGTIVVIAEDHIDFDITLTAVDPASDVATLLIKHVPPPAPRIRVPAEWMRALRGQFVDPVR